MKTILKRAFLTWQRPLAIIYLIFIVATTIFPNLPDSRFKWHILFNFTLSAEMNLAAWLSGVSLLMMALLSYELFSVNVDGNKKAWLVLAAVFFGLCLDEIGSLHERIVGDWSSLIPYVTIGFLLLSYAVGPLFFKEDTRKTAVFILIGFSLFGLVALQEIIEHAVDWPDWARGIRVGLEEGTELVGMFFCFSGLVIQRQRYLPSTSVDILIPDPARLKYLPVLTGGGLALHFFAVPVVSAWTDIGLRGNPAVVYPSTIFIIVATAAFWQSQRDKGQHHFWLSLAAYATVGAIGVVYLSNLILGDVVWLPSALFLLIPPILLWRVWFSAVKKRKFMLFTLTHFILFCIGLAYHSQLAIDRALVFELLANFYFLSLLILFAAFQAQVTQRLSNRDTAVFSALSLLWLTGYLIKAPIVQFAILGALAYYVARLFLQPSSALRPYPVNPVA